MATITNSPISVTFTISRKDSSGNVTINASFHNSSDYAYRARLSCSPTDGSPWTRIGDFLLSGGETRSASGTIACGNPSQTTNVYCYLIKANESTGNGGAYTAEAWVDPNPFAKKKLTITPTEEFMGKTLNISETSGTGVSSTTRTWSAGGQSGSFSIGNWTIPTSVFEQLCRNTTYIDVTFTLRSSGAGGSGSDSKVVRIKVPSNYMPYAEHMYEFIEARNNSLIAGLSQLKVTLLPSVVPSDNTATIASVELQSVSSTNPALTKNSFTKSGNVFTSTTLPTQSGVPSYTFSLTFRITDSRGNVLDYTTGTFRVTNFVPPYVTITNLKRNSATTGVLSVDINSPSAKYAAYVRIGDGNPINVLNKLVAKTGGYTLTYNFSNLVSGNQYNVTFIYQDTNMHNYGEDPYQYSQLLSTMQMPLSLYDNGAQMIVSVGEECADSYPDTTSDTIFNLGQDAEMRATDELGNSSVIKAYELLNLPEIVRQIVEDILDGKNFKWVTADEYAYLVEEGEIDDDTEYHVYGESQ